MKLKDWLTLSRTSQTDLACKVGTNVSTINRVLKGGKIPTHDIVVRIYFVTLGAVQPNDFYDLASIPPEMGPVLLNQQPQA